MDEVVPKVVVEVEELEGGEVGGRVEREVGFVVGGRVGREVGFVVGGRVEREVRFVDWKKEVGEEVGVEFVGAVIM